LPWVWGVFGSYAAASQMSCNMTASLQLQSPAVQYMATRPAGIVLRVSGLRKEFRFYHHSWDRFLEWVSGGRIRRGQSFVALDDVTFEVARGSALGIIGANGAGKSTLLKIISGTLYPTAGRVEVTGRVASLLELGTGFLPDFTGRQNLVFNARFLGLSDREIHERIGAIIDFSELGEFIDRPLRTYSSGMQVRLAFSVVANVDPQILIIDEAMAVGDAYFQQKCIKRIRQFREEGVTLLFVSHDPGAVKTLCDEAVLLHHGRLLERGAPEDVLAYYHMLVTREASSRELLSLEGTHATASEAAPRRSGNFAAIIASVSLRDERNRESRSFLPGEEASIIVRVLFLEEVTDPTIGILIRDRLGNDIYGTNTYHQQIVTGHYDVGEELEVAFRMALQLGPGEYNVTVAAHTLDVHFYDAFDWIERLVVFKVLLRPAKHFIGVSYLQPHISCMRLPRSGSVVDREQALVQVFGAKFPRELVMGREGKPWLFAGWHPPDRSADRVLCWTEGTCSFLLDLRGEQLCVEAGTDRPGAAPEALVVSVWLFEQRVGTFLLNTTTLWAVYTLPLPRACRVAHGFVRMHVAEWCPAEVGLNDDQRRLGLRVRKVWVAEEGTGR
jgi:lipopolysaccharide transport system ATP-binding protein